MKNHGNQPHLDVLLRLKHFFTIPFLAMLIGAGCTTEQNGGWKSKGGSNKPIEYPNFSSATMPETLSTIAIRMFNPLVLLEQDALICEQSVQIKGPVYTLNYDVISSMLGFNLFQIHKEERLHPISTLDSQANLSLHEMEMAHVVSAEDFIAERFAAIRKLDATFADEVLSIISNLQELSAEEPSELSFYKTADDGRKCYTSNLLLEDFEQQKIVNLNPQLFKSLSAQDQSFLLIHSALNVFSRRYGMIDIDQLSNFVYYMHTKDFQSDIEDVNVTPKALHQLLTSFLPEYERTFDED